MCDPWAFLVWCPKHAVKSTLAQPMSLTEDFGASASPLATAAPPSPPSPPSASERHSPADVPMGFPTHRPPPSPEEDGTGASSAGAGAISRYLSKFARMQEASAPRDAPLASAISDDTAAPEPPANGADNSDSANAGLPLVPYHRSAQSPTEVSGPVARFPAALLMGDTERLPSKLTPKPPHLSAAPPAVHLATAPAKVPAMQPGAVTMLNSFAEGSSSGLPSSDTAEDSLAPAALTNGVTTPKQGASKQKCDLCLRSGGEIMAIDGKLVHEACAVWAPMAYYDDAGKIVNIAAEVKRARKMVSPMMSI